MEHHCHVDTATKSVTKEALARGLVSSFHVSGMGCQNCATRVQNALLAQDGVLDAHVDIETHMARVTYEPAKATMAALASAVAAAGGNDGHHNYQAHMAS